MQTTTIEKPIGIVSFIVSIETGSVFFLDTETQDLMAAPMGAKQFAHWDESEFVDIDLCEDWEQPILRQTEICLKMMKR